MLKKLLTMRHDTTRPPVLYRHGDVLVAAIHTLPADAEPIAGLVLARGEATGHAHRIAEEDGRAILLRAGAELFLEVRDQAATLVHDEHGPIALDPGLYRVWKQREYVPAGRTGTVTFRAVAD
jgi:hypothetical protein